MMTGKEIGKILSPASPGVYSPTTADVKLTFDDGSFLVGYFDCTERSEELALENRFTFIRNQDNQNYKKKRDQNFVTIINADKLIQVEYPSYRKR